MLVSMTGFARAERALPEGRLIRNDVHRRNPLVFQCFNLLFVRNERTGGIQEHVIIIEDIGDNHSLT